jgi:hypothetical protein
MTDSQCRVVSGKWIDPFTGQVFTDPSELDIDHVVPLKEAHESGAWQWDAEKRRRFANYLGDDHHLIAVHRSANRSKGAGDPAEWLPSNLEFRKAYARAWVQIKVKWGLSADAAELAVLREILKGEDIVFPREAPEYVCNPAVAAPRSSRQATLQKTNGVVKKSSTGICHDQSSRWYEQTKQFTPYNTLQGCLDSGGRLPK